MSIRIFKTIPAIIEAYQDLFPLGAVEQTINNDGQLCISLIRARGNDEELIPIRVSQRSGYYLAYIPDGKDDIEE